MRKSNFFSTVLFLFLLVPASITRAQTITSQKGLTTAIFPTQHGNVKVYLPDDIRPGDIISGTVMLEPLGKNAKQIEKNLSELVKYTVNADGNKIIMSRQPELFQWLAHTDRKISATLELINVSGIKAGQLPLQFNLNNAVNRTSEECKMASHALTGSPVSISGPFDGDFSNTKCILNEQPVQILAESPRQCIIRFPTNAAGLETLGISDKKAGQCELKVSGVQLSVSAGKLNLIKGEKTFIDVKITGLQNLEDTAMLSLENLSVATVALSPADYIVIPLAPADAASGIFTRRFDIQSIKSGNFSVNVDLDLPGNYSGAPMMFDMREMKNESGYPGSYGYKGDEPCNPEGSSIKWRWHKTFACQIDERKVLPCGHSKEGNDVYEKLKELLEELELDKATDIGEKMAKAFSTAKTFSYTVHAIRKWVDYDIEYKCINGKWQPVGGVYVKHGTDDLGWHSVKHLSTECWLTFDSPAAEKEFEEALENTLRAACK